MTDTASLSSDELYDLGLEIGKMASSRPDIVHRILVGVRDGLENSDLPPATTINGDVFWTLWRHWYYQIKQGNMQAHPIVPFLSLAQPSGTGKVKG